MNPKYEACSDPAKRHDFLLLFDVSDGNPNGDPDAGNMPRIDPETAHGLVTDVCLKRKVRDFVALAQEGESPYRIYIQNDGIALNTKHGEAYKARSIKPTGSKQKREDVQTVRQWMCEQFYDVRCFGAVMSNEVNAGQVRGPLQLTFGRSVDPIASLEVAISRVSITKQKDAEVVVGEDDKGEGGKVTEFGRKAILPYALYVARGFYSPSFGKQTGVTPDDLALFWRALEMMWEQDRSAARGMMTCRGLYVFSHATPLGDAPAHKLFEHLDVCRKEGVEVPRRFADYRVTPPSASAMPSGITLSPLVEG
jgi:CRISPR-associated protein Csd2